MFAVRLLLNTYQHLSCRKKYVFRGSELAIYCPMSVSVLCPDLWRWALRLRNVFPSVSARQPPPSHLDFNSFSCLQHQTFWKPQNVSLIGGRHKLQLKCHMLTPHCVCVPETVSSLSHKSSAVNKVTVTACALFNMQIHPSPLAFRSDKGRLSKLHGLYVNVRGRNHGNKWNSRCSWRSEAWMNKSANIF